LPSSKNDLIVPFDIYLLPGVPAVQVADRQMFHLSKLLQQLVAGGRLMTVPVIAQVRTHIFVLQSSSLAPVFPAPAAWQRNQVINQPKNYHRAKIWKRVMYRGAKQAAYCNKKCNKK